MADSPKKAVDVPQEDKPARPSLPGVETSRAADSVPMVSGSFSSLPMRFGRYRIDKLLGKGSMGAVYLAYDEPLDRFVALKVARVSATGSAKLIKRMETEAKAAANLDHPLICKVYDFGEIDGIRYIALQYVEGEDLKAYLKRVGRRRNPAEAVQRVLQMTRALAVAHEKGILHRDLKPENVMLNRKGQPVIMDFGLARRITASTDANLTQGMIIGTAAYMSPEQAIGKADDIDQRTDLYAMGVMLFEMLTGEWPFAGSALEIMGAKCILDPPAPHTFNSELPPELAAICQKMIAKRKEDRFASCHEFIAALESVKFTSPETVDAVQPPSVTASPVMLKPVADTIPKRKRSAGKPRQVALVQKKPASGFLTTSRTWLSAQLPATRWTAIRSLFVLLMVLSVWNFFPGKDHSPKNVPTTKVAETDPQIDDAPRFLDATTQRSMEEVVAVQQAWARDLKMSVETVDRQGGVFRLIPPGEFEMGNHESLSEIVSLFPYAEAHPEWISDAVVRHRVRITRPFLLDAHEVSIRRFRQFVEESGYSTDAEKDGRGSWGYVGGRPVQDKKFNWKFAEYDPRPTDDDPVSYVSWNDAAAYCNWLSRKEGKSEYYLIDGTNVTIAGGVGYRLPTEAEWEYACRAGTTTRYYSGDDPESLPQIGNVADIAAKTRSPKVEAISSSDGFALASPVGTFRANNFGLYDMIGNVWEWCADWYDADYYLSSPGEDPKGPLIGTKRVCKGSYWNDAAAYCRPAMRRGFAANMRSERTGFRVARDCVEPAALITALDNSILRPGDVWRGRKTYLRGSWEGTTVDYELHVTEVQQSHFKGYVFDKGYGKNRAEVTGEITGTTIVWHEHLVRVDNDDRSNIVGEIARDQITLSFKRELDQKFLTEGTAELRNTRRMQETPITPIEAKKRLNESVVVRMEVKSAGGVDNRYLNSHDDYKDPENFEIFISKNDRVHFSIAGIESPENDYRGKIIDVQGTVIQVQGKYRIVAVSPDQIKIVKNDSAP